MSEQVTEEQVEDFALGEERPAGEEKPDLQAEKPDLTELREEIDKEFAEKIKEPSCKYCGKDWGILLSGADFGICLDCFKTAMNRVLKGEYS